MVARGIARDVEDVEGNGGKEKGLVDEDSLGNLRKHKVLIHGEDARFHAHLVAGELLLIPEFPKAKGIGIVDQVYLVQIADESVGERLFAVQPERAHVEMAAFVADELLRVEVEGHGEQALVSFLDLPATGDD